VTIDNIAIYGGKTRMSYNDKIWVRKDTHEKLFSLDLIPQTQEVL